MSHATLGSPAHTQGFGFYFLTSGQIKKKPRVPNSLIHTHSDCVCVCVYVGTNAPQLGKGGGAGWRPCWLFSWDLKADFAAASECPVISHGPCWQRRTHSSCTCCDVTDHTTKTKPPANWKLPQCRVFSPSTRLSLKTDSLLLSFNGVLKKTSPQPLHYTWTAANLSPVSSFRSGRVSSSQLPQGPGGCPWQIMVGFGRWKRAFHLETWSLTQLSSEQRAKWLKQVLLCTQCCLHIN